MRAWKTRARGFRNFRFFVTQFVVLIFAFASCTFAQSLGHGNSPTHQSALAARVRALNNSLLQLHGQMQEASQNGMAWVRGQAATVIAERAGALTTLIQQEPHTPLSFAFSPEMLADLPAKFPDSATQFESHATV